MIILRFLRQLILMKRRVVRLCRLLLAFDVVVSGSSDELSCGLRCLSSSCWLESRSFGAAQLARSLECP